MFCGVPREVFPHGQNQRPKEENFKLPADFTEIYPRGVGEAVGLHPSLPAPWDEELASPLEFLQWVNSHIKRTH